MKKFKRIWKAICVCSTLIVTGCTNEKLEQHVLAESEALPDTVGRLVIENVSYDGKSCVYDVRVSSKYFNPTDNKETDKIFKLLKNHQFTNKSNNKENTHSGHGFDILMECVSDNIPITYRIFADDSTEALTEAGRTWNMDEIKKYVVERSRDDDEVDLMLGDYSYAKGDNPDVASIRVSRHYYILSQDEDLETLRMKVIKDHAEDPELKEERNKYIGGFPKDILKNTIKYDIYYYDNNDRQEQFSISLKDIDDYAKANRIYF